MSPLLGRSPFTVLPTHTCFLLIRIDPLSDAHNLLTSSSERPVSPDLGYVAMNEEIRNTMARPKTFTAQKQGLFEVAHN